MRNSNIGRLPSAQRQQVEDMIRSSRYENIVQLHKKLEAAGISVSQWTLYRYASWLKNVDVAATNSTQTALVIFDRANGTVKTIDTAVTAERIEAAVTALERELGELVGTHR